MWFEPESINDSCFPHWQVGRKPGLEVEGRREAPIGAQSAADQVGMLLIEMRKLGSGKARTCSLEDTMLELDEKNKTGGYG